MVPLKHFNTQSRISLEILKQCSLNLAPEMYVTKETKWHLSCRRHDSSYAAGPVLIKTNITRFYLKQGSSTPNNLMGELRQYGNHVCSEQDPLSLFKGLQIGIFVFSQKETGARRVAMATTQGVILFLVWCTFVVPSLKNSAPIFLEIFLNQCFTVQVKPPMMSSLSSFA